ncbi:MAG: hypothetical protein EOL87_07310 [Spartobacteria bacterium]|nr:hypothetical protein [Spartobacteria bacterium]
MIPVNVFTRTGKYLCLLALVKTKNRGICKQTAAYERIRDVCAKGYLHDGPGKQLYRTELDPADNTDPKNSGAEKWTESAGK